MEEQGLQVDDEAAEGPSLATFTFTNQGQTEPVYYDNCFNLGHTLYVRRPSSAVPFMQQKEKDPTFKWPESESTEEGHLFGGGGGDFELVPPNCT